MKEKQNPILSLMVAVILALGLLPSLSALSMSLVHQFPRIVGLTGPINFLKLGAPVLCLFFWRNRFRFSSSFWVNATEVVFWLTVTTAMAAMLCKAPPVDNRLHREYFAILLGGLSALCFLLLDKTVQKKILFFWLFAVYGGALLDALVPSGSTWLYDHVFDPKTRDWDLIELGKYPLTGIFGRQSLAKLMAWLPWVAMAFFRPKRFWFWLGFAGISTAVILATTQRGPFLGCVAGWIAFIVHQLIQRRRTRVAKWATVGLIVGVLSAPLFVPSDILVSRLSSLVHWQNPTASEGSAGVNIGYRFKMLSFTLNVIKENYWGDACITTPTFWIAGILHAAHSHHMFLQQYRERGWVWGTMHLGLWIFALWRAWRIRSYLGSPVLAAVVSVVISGLFDHPWFVLNQSMVLWIVLLTAILPKSFPRPGFDGASG